MCAGRVEIKLRESEVEMFHHQLEVKRGQVDLLMKQVQSYKDKCHAVQKQSKDEMSSSTYSYAYVSGGRNDPTASALEKHLTEQMMNQLAAENLRYKIRLAAEAAAKQQLQRHLESLERELKDLRRVQSKFEAQQSLYSSRQQQPPPIPPRHPKAVVLRDIIRHRPPPPVIIFF